MPRSAINQEIYGLLKRPKLIAACGKDTKMAATSAAPIARQYTRRLN
jgi:hypothetical protein